MLTRSVNLSNITVPDLIIIIKMDSVISLLAFNKRTSLVNRRGYLKVGAIGVSHTLIE